MHGSWELLYYNGEIKIECKVKISHTYIYLRTYMKRPVILILAPYSDITNPHAPIETRVGMSIYVCEFSFSTFYVSYIFI